MHPPLYSRLTIDLDAIAANYNALVQKAPRAHVAGVLKANAYGLGAEKVAHALYHAGCRHFFVAYMDEALALHKALGPLTASVTIYILNGPYLPGWAATVAHYGFVPVLNTLQEIEAWHTHGRALGRKLPTCVHVDVGMHRLAMPMEVFQTFVRQDWPFMDVQLVMGHLTSADEHANPMNEKQRLLFETQIAYFPRAIKSLANSSAIFQGQAYHYDMVRPGMALYGLNPTPYAPNPMVPVITAQARILQVQDVHTGEAVGYNATFTAPHPMRLATIALGYADGIPHALSNAGYGVVVHGVLAPVVGRISMDLISVDVTAIPQASVGDWADVINHVRTANHLAKAAGISPYEVITRLGARYSRCYKGSVA
jgi:alanine racemase